MTEDSSQGCGAGPRCTNVAFVALAGRSARTEQEGRPGSSLGSLHGEPRPAVDLDQADPERAGKSPQRGAAPLRGEGQVSGARIRGVQRRSRHSFTELAEVPFRFDDDDFIPLDRDEIRPPGSNPEPADD